MKNEYCRWCGDERPPAGSRGHELCEAALALETTEPVTTFSGWQHAALTFEAEHIVVLD